jgi:hypothetical protein
VAHPTHWNQQGPHLPLVVFQVQVEIRQEVLQWLVLFLDLKLMV